MLVNAKGLFPHKKRFINDLFCLPHIYWVTKLGITCIEACLFMFWFPKWLVMPFYIAVESKRYNRQCLGWVTVACTAVIGPQWEALTSRPAAGGTAAPGRHGPAALQGVDNGHHWAHSPTGREGQHSAVQGNNLASFYESPQSKYLIQREIFSDPSVPLSVNSLAQFFLP